MDAWKTAAFAIMHTAIADGVNSTLEAAYHFILETGNGST
jgi:hypothetical protein